MNLNKHANFFNPEPITDTIHIIGCGAVGSNLAHTLVRLGFENIALYDFDGVSPHNITNQFFFTHQMGSLKEASLKTNLLAINPECTVSLKGKYKKQALNGIVFLAIDSIEERKRIVELNKFNYNIKIISDIRLGLTEAQCFTATPKHFEKLLSTMQFKDEEATGPRNTCGSTLQILPTINIIVSLATTNLIHFVKNKEYFNMIFTDSMEMLTTKFK